MDTQYTATEDGIPVVRVAGKLDALSAPGYEQQLLRLIADGAERILVDLGALTYISSAGLRAILNTVRPLESAGGRMTFAAPRNSVRDMFEMTGLLNMLRIHDSAEAALTDLQAL